MKVSEYLYIWSQKVQPNLFKGFIDSTSHQPKAFV